ncbi:MAG TPA: hypothetical protein VFA54_02520 [Bryobacterales bacterium]|jgi:hypothetical protein|nr:hypothetical protein [Bryobacterales bacterium]
MRKIALTAVLSVVATLVSVHYVPAANLPTITKLENPKVTVTEMDYLRGVPREPYVRPTDQVIVFLDDATYDRIDPATGAKQRVTRKSGDVIWHDKGDHAPRLINMGAKTYRTLIIALK